MTDIQAIRKAAEAARDAREKLRDAEGSGNYDYLYGHTKFLERMLGTRLDPATVLELCRNRQTLDAVIDYVDAMPDTQTRADLIAIINREQP